jgi:hypothetical protein
MAENKLSNILMNGAVYFKSENSALNHTRNKTTNQKSTQRGDLKAKLEAEKFVSNERYLQS